MVLLAGCEQPVGDAGCQLVKQVVIPEGPFALMPNARIDRVGSRFIIVGSDGTAVRWVSLSANGSVGPEQVFPLPGGASRVSFAVAGADSPADRVLIAYLEAAANGTDANLRVVAVPIEGGSGSAPGAPLYTIAGGVGGQPPLVLGSSRSGWHAGLAWLDGATGLIMLAALDGRGELANPPAPIEASPAERYECLAFEPGRADLSDELTLTYLRYASDPAAPPTWAMAEATEGGAITKRLNLTVAQPGAGMSCARGAPFSYGVCNIPGSASCTGHAIVWQDAAGSWLSVYDRRSESVRSHPFAAATDFGGPALQPPLVGIAPFGSEFGVLLARPRSVELWRLDQSGGRRPGALVFPSLAGEIGSVSAVPGGGVLTATYADYMGPPDPTPKGRRIVADAVCH